MFLGTSVRSGTAVVLIAATGSRTAYGAIAESLQRHPPETDFERGLRQFGYLLLRVMVLTVVAVLVATQALGQPSMESLLFAVALAIGLSPELLPAIVSVTLTKGARGIIDEVGIVAHAALQGIRAQAAIQNVVGAVAGEHVAGVIARAVDDGGAGEGEVLDMSAQRVGNTSLNEVGAFIGQLHRHIGRAIH